VADAGQWALACALACGVMLKLLCSCGHVCPQRCSCSIYLQFQTSSDHESIEWDDCCSVLLFFGLSAQTGLRLSSNSAILGPV
jgi:hypothetical protein